MSILRTLSILCLTMGVVSSALAMPPAPPRACHTTPQGQECLDYKRQHPTGEDLCAAEPEGQPCRDYRHKVEVMNEVRNCYQSTSAACQDFQACLETDKVAVRNDPTPRTGSWISPGVLACREKLFQQTQSAQ